MNQKDIFIEAKLSPPALTSGIVERERLLSLLNAKTRLTLIIAGAGYGKTTLLAQFVGGLKQPFVWYSLDKRDNDISVFISYIVHGISQKFKGFGKKTLTALNYLKEAGLQSIEKMFISEASDIIMDGWQNRNRSDDIVSEKRSDAILGRERLYNPETGDVYEFENGFYDKYNINRDRYEMNNLTPLPNDNYDLWMKAPLDGYRNIR